VTAPAPLPEEPKIKPERMVIEGHGEVIVFTPEDADTLQCYEYALRARLQEEIAKREEAIAHGKLLQESAWNLGVATGKKESESRAAALQKDNDALIVVIDAVMNIPNMTDAQLEQLKANCRAALSKESK
jgi:hypothetical protein